MNIWWKIEATYPYKGKHKTINITLPFVEASDAKMVKVIENMIHDVVEEAIEDEKRGHKKDRC